MSIMLKIASGIGAVLLIVVAICVTIAALFPPREYKGGGMASNPDKV